MYIKWVILIMFILEALTSYFPFPNVYMNIVRKYLYAVQKQLTSLVKDNIYQCRKYEPAKLQLLMQECRNQLMLFCMM